jgi:hypothetical protein
MVGINTIVFVFHFEYEKKDLNKLIGIRSHDFLELLVRHVSKKSHDFSIHLCRDIRKTNYVANTLVYSVIPIRVATDDRK